MAIIEKKFLVDVEHVGKNTLLTNHGILNLLESIACYHSNMVGYGINDIEKTKATWVLLNWKVQVLKRVPYGTYVTVKTWANYCGKISTLRDFEIYDENNNLLCMASSKWAFIDLNSNRIAKITPEVINLYESEEKNVFNQTDIEKLKFPQLPTSPAYTFKVQRRDIDINNHLHNIYYLDYAYEALPEEVYLLPEANNFEIMYKSGILSNSFVNCYYIKEANNYFVVMKSYDDKLLHAVIKLSKS